MTNKKIFMIEALIKSEQAVDVFLVNGICLKGRLVAQTSGYLVLSDFMAKKAPQIIYRHAISTIVPIGAFDVESALVDPMLPECKQGEALLDAIMSQNLSTSVFMMNGIRLVGILVSQTEESFLMKVFNGCQEIRKAAIATIVPS
ncbi:RNA chaperone Hfq [Aeromonas veronii]|uniref:RNA-binding protein n=1 Tax=Aeromonas veronii TaxID=654 RepID=A0A2T4MZL7_AERVE|nr:RNA chaperone Hfq [Aeromonas veronii]PTH80007.1 hypothetical protein DAA48_15700 [Aeromonas veronii]